MSEEMVKEMEMELENENIEIEEVEGDVYDPEYSESSSGNRGGALAAGVGLVAALVGGGIYLWKNRDKIKAKRTEKQIAKLEKKGYKVYNTNELEGTVAEVYPEETYDDEEVSDDE